MMLSAKAFSGRWSEMRDVRGKEIVVLEEAEQAEIGRQANYQRDFA